VPSETDDDLTRLADTPSLLLEGGRRLIAGEGQPAVPRGGDLETPHRRAVGRDIPERFGDGVKVHRRFSRWAQSGVWERIFRALADDPDNEYAMIGSTIVWAHQHSAGARKKGAKIKPSDDPAAG
jgi:hypothetical protein